MPKDYSLNVTPANAQRRPENAQDDDGCASFCAAVNTFQTFSHISVSSLFMLIFPAHPGVDMPIMLF